MSARARSMWSAGRPWWTPKASVPGRKHTKWSWNQSIPSHLGLGPRCLASTETSQLNWRQEALGQGGSAALFTCRLRSWQSTLCPRVQGKNYSAVLTGGLTNPAFWIPSTCLQTPSEICCFRNHREDHKEGSCTQGMWGLCLGLSQE